jgi:hypothetical protein
MVLDSNLNVGIGTDNPTALLHTYGAGTSGGNVLFEGLKKDSTGYPPISGAGTRMMWYPDKAAFRAGYVETTNWDKDSIGVYSVAMGYNTKAKGNTSTAMGANTNALGYASTAMGDATTASGYYSTAMGYYTTASGESSTAMGNQTTASGYYSTAMGYYPTASGSSSTAMGEGTIASGDHSTAMGDQTEASGESSTAMGQNTQALGTASTSIGNHTIASGSASFAMGDYTDASGDNSTAMGTHTTASGHFSTALGNYVSTNNQTGSFIIGDHSTTTEFLIGGNNQMRMRFAGGYYLNSGGSYAGVFLSPGECSWECASDSTKKENYRPVNGDYFLGSLSKLRLGSWNYKGQDSKSYRHYGPMAQEIYHYFGNDGIGTIGCDTTLTTADMDGIMMICLQALERKTSELQNKNKELDEANRRISNLEERLAIVEKLTGKLSVLETAAKR